MLGKIGAVSYQVEQSWQTKRAGHIGNRIAASGKHIIDFWRLLDADMVNATTEQYLPYGRGRDDAELDATLKRLWTQ